MSDFVHKELTSEEIENFLIQAHVYTQDGQSTEINALPSDETHQLEGNITITCDLDFEGRYLIIRGNLVVEGELRNAQLIVLGSAVFKGWIRNSVIYTLHEATISIARESTVVAFGDITVQVECERCFLTSAGMIYGGAAAFRGGRVAANYDVEVGIAQGMGEAQRMILVCGDRKILIQKVLLWNKKLASLEASLEKTKQSVQAIIKTLIARNMLGVKIPKLDELKQEQRVLEQEIVERKEYIEELKAASLRKELNGKVVVKNKAVEVSVIIEGVQREIKDTIPPGSFYIYENVLKFVTNK